MSLVFGDAYGGKRNVLLHHWSQIGRLSFQSITWVKHRVWHRFHSMVSLSCNFYLYFIDYLYLCSFWAIVIRSLWVESQSCYLLSFIETLFHKMHCNGYVQSCVTNLIAAYLDVRNWSFTHVRRESTFLRGLFFAKIKVGNIWCYFVSFYFCTLVTLF